MKRGVKVLSVTSGASSPHPVSLAMKEPGELIQLLKSRIKSGRLLREAA